ncbi:hypothetical protein OPT61_g3270 [Boeremia exigua]|uniref:Uncharacterized protein n=1 Tax=Boeremia exigua TaxID=749465 RepID=A0ACC2IIR0_9PLEO|nr:hypothetical protein OPT61_g3270 [Boeremia exigua]
MAFVYRPLDASTSIRLLKVLPREQDNDQICIEIWEESEDVPYRCLSYTWGAPLPTFAVEMNGRTFQIGKNLFEFLSVASKRFSNEALWIDAICINQNDDTEKATQVQRMGTIYKGATEVLAWLGVSDSISRLFDWTCEPPKKSRRLLRFLPVDNTPKHLRPAARELSTHPYWTRAWILQELMLARSTRFLCGGAETTEGALRRCSKGDLLNWDATSMVFRFLDKTRQASEAINLWSVLDTRANCINPRDRIYSTLAVLGQENKFRIDYSESVLDTFWRVAEHFSAWIFSHHLQALWQALDISRDVFLTALKGTNSSLWRCAIPLRRCKVVVKESRSTRLICKCTNSSWDFYSIAGLDIDDVLLCPYQNFGPRSYSWHGSSAHFILSQIRDHQTDRFTTWLPCESNESRSKEIKNRRQVSDWSELWYSCNGAESVVERWTDVQRIADLGGGADDQWKDKPHFVLKLDYRYVLQCVDEVLLDLVDKDSVDPSLRRSSNK